jgi:hypothetical protein
MMTSAARDSRLSLNLADQLLVADLRDLLRALERAYNAVFVFDSLIIGGASRGASTIAENLLLIGSVNSDTDFSSFVGPEGRLVIGGLQIQSPGFLEVVGALNPLEVVRQYLNDIHQRRQDRSYRERAEERRLELENLKLENEVVRERIDMLRHLGVAEEQIMAIVNVMVYGPLRELGEFDNRQIIESY